MTVSVPASPSTPSEQFVAFIVNQRIAAATGTYAQPGMSHTPTSPIIVAPFTNGNHVTMTCEPSMTSE